MIVLLSLMLLHLTGTLYGLVHEAGAIRHPDILEYLTISSV